MNTNLCSCGCGGSPALATSMFLPGHDGRLRGSVVRAARGAAPMPAIHPEAQEWLEATHGHPCACGCGRLVRGTFAQGHDAKLRSVVLRAVRGELEMPSLGAVALAWLRTAHWMTGEIDEAIHGMAC